MNDNKMNQSHGLSCDGTLFLSYKQFLKVKIACSYLIACSWFLLIRGLSINVTKVVVVGSDNWEIFKIRYTIAE